MNTEQIEAYPLQWPIGFERSLIKKESPFTCTLSQARDGVINEIRLLKGINSIISSNIPTKRNGDLYASMKPTNGDNGVAVYFTWKNQQYVFACDKYYHIQDNLRAIEKSIDAIRGLERWGASDMLTRAFTGFKLLENSTEKWYEILNVDKKASQEEIKQAYRFLSKKYHPDIPLTGNRELWDKIEKAYQQTKI